MHQFSYQKNVVWIVVKRYAFEVWIVVTESAIVIGNKISVLKPISIAHLAIMDLYRYRCFRAIDVPIPSNQLNDLYLSGNFELHGKLCQLIIFWVDQVIWYPNVLHFALYRSSTFGDTLIILADSVLRFLNTINFWIVYNSKNPSHFFTFFFIRKKEDTNVTTMK